MTVQCCKCKKVQCRGTWVTGGGAMGEDVSHSYCPICVEETLEEIRMRQAVHGPDAIEFANS